MNRWVLGLLIISLYMMPGLPRANAVALGKIAVASHLGETFFAEIPMQLEENEKISSVFVSLAPPADYRILEVYHDPALNTVRSEVKNDSRGIRVELSSDSVMDAPFFNLILKVRHGHATNFKKYAVFLDLPQASMVQARSLPTVSAVRPQVQATQKAQPKTPISPTTDIVTPDTGSAVSPAFKPYAGWARTGHYGPIVYGDTIGTVASRLRVDKRYTLQQVIMALFYKNKNKFSQGNVNLIHAGAYLKIPTASEVETITPAQAKALLAKHNHRWNELKKQPRYAAVAKAQKNRYRARVRMGKDASGVASVSRSANARKRTSTEAENVKTTEPAKQSVKPTLIGKTIPPSASQTTQTTAILQKKLKIADAKITALSDKLASAGVVAASAHIKKLELSLARLHAQMDQNQQEAKARGATHIQWATYLLGTLVAMLLGTVGFLLTRQSSPHPVTVSMSASAVPMASSPDVSLEGERQEYAEMTPANVVEDPEQQTAQTDTQEAEEQTVENGIPEPAELDTIDTETEEVVKDEAAPNIDHMTEADVYLRYGMTDEAIGQLELLLTQQPDNADAHIKLLETLQSKGEKTRVHAAIEAGRAALSGEELQAFEATISQEDIGNTEDDDIDFGDTLPITGLEEPVTEETDNTDTAGLSKDADEQQKKNSDAEDVLDISDFNIDDLDWNAQPEDGEEAKQPINDGTALDLSMETTDLENIVKDTGTSVETAGSGNPETISDLDELLTELEIETEETLDIVPSQDSLNIDKARSLLAEGALDEAESSFNTAMEVDNKREDSLIGLAEVAQQRGDGIKAAELLAEAEPLIDDNNREWFESIKRKQEQ